MLSGATDTGADTGTSRHHVRERGGEGDPSPSYCHNHIASRFARCLLLLQHPIALPNSPSQCKNTNLLHSPRPHRLVFFDTWLFCCFPSVCDLAKVQQIMVRRHLQAEKMAMFWASREGERIPTYYIKRAGMIRKIPSFSPIARRYLGAFQA